MYAFPGVINAEWRAGWVKLANRPSRLPIFTAPYSRRERLTESCSARLAGYRRHQPRGLTMGKDARPTAGKRKHHLRVPVFPDEKQVIGEQARRAGMSGARFLRDDGQGYRIGGG